MVGLQVPTSLHMVGMPADVHLLQRRFVAASDRRMHPWHFMLQHVQTLKRASEHGSPKSENGSGRHSDLKMFESDKEIGNRQSEQSVGSNGMTTTSMFLRD